MARTRAAPRRRPNVNFDARQRGNIDFEAQRVAGTKEIRRRIRASDVKIKFLLPRVKDIEVKVRGNVVRKMKVQRVAKHSAEKRNVRYG